MSSEEELKTANRWWRNLSINQMKAYEIKHFPILRHVAIHSEMICEMWEKEGKPEPQELRAPRKFTMVRTIVVGEHTLGVIYPNGLQVLRGVTDDVMYFDPDNCVEGFRPATERDFEDYRVMFNPQYLEVEEFEFA